MLKLFRYLRKRDLLFAAISVEFIVLQVWLDLLMPDYTANLTQEIASGDPTLGAVWRNGGGSCRDRRYGHHPCDPLLPTLPDHSKTHRPPQQCHAGERFRRSRHPCLQRGGVSGTEI